VTTGLREHYHAVFLRSESRASLIGPLFGAALDDLILGTRGLDVRTRKADEARAQDNELPAPGTSDDPLTSAALEKHFKAALLGNSPRKSSRHLDLRQLRLQLNRCE